MLAAPRCGGDDDGSSDTTAASSETHRRRRPTRPPPARTPPPAGADTTTATGGETVDVDTNGDGKVVIGIATPGLRNDGAYYQALVDGLTGFSEEHGFEEPIVVDNITPEEAQTSLDSLARQNVDIIAVGAGEIADSLPELTETYADVMWYCNCGGGFQGAAEPHPAGRRRLARSRTRPAWPPGLLMEANGRHQGRA